MPWAAGAYFQPLKTQPFLLRYQKGNSRLLLQAKAAPQFQSAHKQPQHPKNGGIIMAMDKRQFPRVELSWPVTVITDDGLVTGRTQNISLDGTLIRCAEIPELQKNFRLIFRPAERELLLATAERVWHRAFVRKYFMPHAVGVRFTFVPDQDYDRISEAISRHI